MKMGSIAHDKTQAMRYNVTRLNDGKGVNGGGVYD